MVWTVRGTKSRWGANIPYPSRPALGKHLSSYTMGPGSYLGVKWPGRRVNHPLPFNAEVNERLAGYRVNFTSPPRGLIRGIHVGAISKLGWLLGFVKHAMCADSLAFQYLLDAPFSKFWRRSNFSITEVATALVKQAGRPLVLWLR